MITSADLAEIARTIDEMEAAERCAEAESFLPSGDVSSVHSPSGTSLASPEATGPLRATPAGYPGAVPPFPQPAPFPVGAHTVPILLRGPAIVTVCAWCQSVVSVTLSPLFSKTMISHGICRACARKWETPRP